MFSALEVLTTMHYINSHLTLTLTKQRKRVIYTVTFGIHTSYFIQELLISYGNDVVQGIMDLKNWKEKIAIS